MRQVAARIADKPTQAHEWILAAVAGHINHRDRPG